MRDEKRIKRILQKIKPEIWAVALDKILKKKNEKRNN